MAPKKPKMIANITPFGIAEGGIFNMMVDNCRFTVMPLQATAMKPPMIPATTETTKTSNNELKNIQSLLIPLLDNIRISLVLFIKEL